MKIVPFFSNEQELAQALNRLKKNYDLTGEQISRGTGASQPLISNWLSGKNKISKKFFQPVSDFIISVWQPALIEVSSFEGCPDGLIMNVADCLDPFRTEILCQDEMQPEEIAARKLLTKQAEEAFHAKKAKFRILQFYKDLDEAKILGSIHKKMQSKDTDPEDPILKNLIPGYTYLPPNLFSNAETT